MPIRFRWDPDLIFLKNCEQDDLRTLAEILIYDNSGKRRKSLGLASNKRYRTCYNDYQSVWDVIAGELQQLGGDSMVNLLRLGHGPLYREILLDVVKKMQIDVDTSLPVETIEMSLILKVVEEALENMSGDEKNEVVEEMKLEVEQGTTTSAIIDALRNAIRIGRNQGYQIAQIIANTITRTLLGKEPNVITYAGLARVISMFMGPVGMFSKIILTVPLISGPAYRITIPATIQVAYMRQKCFMAPKEKVADNR